MPNILFIDDNEKLGTFTKNAILEDDSYQVDWISEGSWEIAAQKVEAIPEKNWDLLILDIEYPTNVWGGIWLYNHLVKLGFKDRWNGRVIVYSKYIGNNINWDNPSDSQMITLRIFLDTAGIPYDCALPNQGFNRVTLMEKINELVK